MCKPFDELLILPNKAQKGSNFHVGLGWSKLNHSFQFLFAGLHTLSGDVMSQIVDLILEEFHTWWVLAPGCAPRSDQT